MSVESGQVSASGARPPAARGGGGGGGGVEGGEGGWQVPHLADVDVPLVPVVGGHDDVARVPGPRQPRHQAGVQEAHLAAPEHAHAAPQHQRGRALRPGQGNS